jgi:hypothetical protein
MKIETHSPEFWTALNAKFDLSERTCQQCRMAHGALRRSGERRVIVRLALVDPAKPANDPNNIGRYCTECRPQPRPKASSKSAMLFE